MRFIGSHQIIKNIGVANSLEMDNSLELDNSLERGNSHDPDKSAERSNSKATHQDIQALLLLVSGMIFFLIAGCTDEKDLSTHEAEIAKVREVQTSAKITTFNQYWQLTDNGIHWSVDSPHQDQLEMSGLQVSAVIDYGLGTDGNLVLDKTLVWPMLRTLPNDTHASLIRKFSSQVAPDIYIDEERVISGGLEDVMFDGQLTLVQMLSTDLKLTRTISVHPSEPALIERWQFENLGSDVLGLRLSPLRELETTLASQGEYGSYQISVDADELNRRLSAGEIVEHFIVYSAKLADEMIYIEPSNALQQRAQQVEGWRSALKLETPDPKINQMFEFAKFRATESIFATRGGLAHGPGGTR